MKEDFLHYVWKFQKFDKRDLKTTSGELVQVLNPGRHNFSSGPDFFNAQLTIANQIWAGNVEIHLKSSHWYTHRHEEDHNYDSVILHVVWEHDAEVFRKHNIAIPVLELKKGVDKTTLENYRKLFSKDQQWINCQNEIASIDSFVLHNWLERLFIERLQQKSDSLLIELSTLKNHWEALLFQLLCKNFGLNINGSAFLSVAKSIDFSIVQKCSHNTLQLEALLFGQAGLLDRDLEDRYCIKLQKTYAFLKYKHKLVNEMVISPKFFRLRPPNFPTIRLSQLASLYSSRPNLFSEIISVKTKDALYQIFEISASSYWDTHFNFGSAVTNRKKKLTKKFIDLLLINTVIPLRFCYANFVGMDASEAVLHLARSIPKEENTIVAKFNTLGAVATHALESQALLQLKNNYCDAKRCLECALGNELLNR